ncbi:hypothetical protein L596_014441 [Steinernema carpocapsae]|uniref:Major facilitator superfamily (MFS) profile domain-containing protein n=1 Tax=Steinernema carpocapsae TaxID=34508 RepID=A0A4U5NC04_STECR|nr:hypothetical protein L596_014441 [Steinernema carpocapsae]
MCFNPAIIVMMDTGSSPLFDPNSNSSDPITWDASYLSLSDRRFIFNTVQKSALLAAVFLGCLIGVPIAGVGMQKIGAHKTMTVIGLITAVTTAIMPLAASIGFWPFFLVRVLQGVSLSNLLPVVGAIIANWSTLHENGLFVSVLTGYIQISCGFALPVSGILASHFGWPSVFYVHGLLCILITGLWQLYFRNDPTTHPFCSEKELSEIRSGKTITKERPVPPYREIFTCPALYGAWIAVVGNFFICQYTITFLPMYLVWVIGLPVDEASVFIAVPLAGQFILKFGTGLCSDKIQCISELTKVRLFNSLAFFGSAALFIIISFFTPGPESRYTSAFLAMIPAVLLGFNPGGYNKAAVLISRQYSATVMAVFQVIVCTTLFFGSFIILAMTPITVSSSTASCSTSTPPSSSSRTRSSLLWQKLRPPSGRSRATFASRKWSCLRALELATPNSYFIRAVLLRIRL